MKKGFLLIGLLLLTLAIACVKPKMVKVTYGPNGGSVEALSGQENGVVPIIQELNDLPAYCLEEASALIASSDPNASTEIDCSTGRFQLRARGTRQPSGAPPTPVTTRTDQKMLDGVIVNNYQSLLVVSINESSGAPTRYQNVNVSPNSQAKLSLKPGDYIVKYKTIDGKWKTYNASPSKQGFRIVIGG